LRYFDGARATYAIGLPTLQNDLTQAQSTLEVTPDCRKDMKQGTLLAADIPLPQSMQIFFIQTWN